MKDIYIDGGNQLATKDTLFVGSDAIESMVNSMNRFPMGYKKIISDLKIKNADKISSEELCKAIVEKSFPHQKLVLVGDKGRQPAFHIDMAMTPLGKSDPKTGKKVMTVGDPSLAIGILKDLKEKSPAKYEEYQKNIRKKLSSYQVNRETIERLEKDKNIKSGKKLKNLLENDKWYILNIYGVNKLAEINPDLGKKLSPFRLKEAEFSEKELYDSLKDLGCNGLECSLVQSSCYKDFGRKELIEKLKKAGISEKEINMILDEAEKISPSTEKPLDFLINEIDGDREFQENFDFLAKNLEKKEEYKVERLPYLGKLFEDAPPVPWLTYNNTVIDGDNIFIPNFDIPELDNPVNKVYKKYGYNPVPVDMTVISSMQGALNCVTKVLERTYEE